MRKPSPTDFEVPVEGVGTFTFAHRNMRDQMRIATEIARLTEGLDYIPEYLAMVSGAMACIKVLAVEVPDGWDPEKLDPVEEDSYRQLLAVHRALRDAEARFRRGLEEGSEGEGPGASKDGDVLVPEEVQSAPE